MIPVITTSNETVQVTTKVLLVGAGAAANQLIATGQFGSKSGFEIAGLVDDNPKLVGLSMFGIPVLGTSRDVADLVRKTDCRLVVVAIASASSILIARLTEQTTRIGVPLLILPRPEELKVPGVATYQDLKSVDMHDLITRPTAKIELGVIAPYFAHQTILITGAGGSIGREICRQLSQLESTQLYLLDRDESLLVETQQLVEKGEAVSQERLLLCDIQNTDSINSIFQTVKPSVVIHAAALKHVTFLERFPHEAVRVNLYGTENVVKAAKRFGASVFINISTDKAGIAQNVLGATKKVAERVVAAQNSYGFKSTSVRFGNVLGSRGSLLPILEQRLQHGLPVTVTSRTATRYFMTINEAVYLVLKGASIAKGGEVLILDMGSPVNIYSFVTTLANLMGSTSPITISSLRSGENEHEELYSKNETPEQTEIPGIMQFCAPLLEEVPHDLINGNQVNLGLLQRLAK